jgi:hypothetical protein
MEILDELLELEHAGWVALCNGTADEFYGDLMTDDAVMVLANGMVMDRDAVVAALRDAPPWSAYEIAAPQVLALGDDVHALVYTATAHRAEGEPFVGAMTSVYVRDGEHWRLALYQQTRRD